MRPLLLFFGVLLGALRLSAQQASAGRVLFSERPITAGQRTPDPLRQYTLTPKHDLYMTVLLARPLTLALQAMAPTLPADSLTGIGSFRCAIFIDHRLVYQSDISTGALESRTKDTATVLTFPLIDNAGQWPEWSVSFWERFLLSGGDSVLTEGPHELRLEIRPYLRLGAQTQERTQTQEGPQTLEGPLIAAGDLRLQVNRKVRIDLTRERISPILPYDGFGISHDRYDTMKIKMLRGLIEAGVFRHITSVVVISNGNILIEEYFNGETRETLHNPRSVGKSFASTLTGMAIRDGYLKSENEPLSAFYNLKAYRNYVPEKDSVTLKDLLTMCSAFDGDDSDPGSPGNEENMYPQDNWVTWALDLPLSTTRPRDRWHYFTGGAMLVGDILNSSVRGGLEVYADQNLFRPLGIRDYRWAYTPQHVVNTAGGIQLKALDFAKYGQLYKNGGVWQGRQVIPADWVKKTFTRYHAVPNGPDQYYGYFFWDRKYPVGATEMETWYCTGNGGNKIFVFRDQPLVIVVTAEAYGQVYAHPQVDKMMTEYILPAILDGTGQ